MTALNPRVYTYVKDMAPRCECCGKREGRHWYRATSYIDGARTVWQWEAYGRTQRSALRRLRHTMVHLDRGIS